MKARLNTSSAVHGLLCYRYRSCWIELIRIGLVHCCKGDGRLLLYSSAVSVCIPSDVSRCLSVGRLHCHHHQHQCQHQDLHHTTVQRSGNLPISERAVPSPLPPHPRFRIHTQVQSFTPCGLNYGYRILR